MRGGEKIPAGEILSLRRTFSASQERVYAAWTDPKLLAQWWGPPGSVVKSVEIDLQVGGSYRIGFQHVEGTLIFVNGTYKEIQPPKKLVFSWRWENPDMDIGDSLVTLEFRALARKTELHLIHERLPTEEARISHKEGWTGILSQLGSFLTKD